jgi:polysaccharide biosynthesis protein PelA
VLENAKKSLELGFQGLFLDTLDSSDEADQLALAKLIVQLRATFPQIALVLNRGFRVLSRVAPIVDGALFEGLSTTWKMLPDGNVKYQKLEKPMRVANHQVAVSIVTWAKKYGFACWALDYADTPAMQTYAKHEAETLGFISFTSNWQLLQIS